MQKESDVVDTLLTTDNFGCILEKKKQTMEHSKISAFPDLGAII